VFGALDYLLALATRCAFSGPRARLPAITTRSSSSQSPIFTRHPNLSPPIMALAAAASADDGFSSADSPRRIYAGLSLSSS